MPYSYKSLSQALANAGIEDSREEAFLLLAHFCGVSRADCLSDRDRVWSGDGLDGAVEKRQTRYPLQYILGEWDFFGLSFRVDERCLIPRPDTEILVEKAIRLLPRGAVIADLCTGSGCIAVSVLANRPDIRAVALEIYPETLALAAENAARNCVSDRFIPLCADLLRDGAEKLSAYAPFDAILSNPPYIPKATVDVLEPELFCEPRAALDGGEDGLRFYRAIFERYIGMIRQGGHLIIEIGHDQAVDLAAMVAPAPIRVFKDLAGNDRVLVMDIENGKCI